MRRGNLPEHWWVREFRSEARQRERRVGAMGPFGHSGMIDEHGRIARVPFTTAFGFDRYERVLPGPGDVTEQRIEIQLLWQ